MTNTKSEPVIEPMDSHGHLICWRSIIGGLFISVMAFMILNALGAGIVGHVALRAVDNQTSGNSLMTWAGACLGISTALALFSGSYFTMRVNRFITHKVGVAHGLLIGSIFLILMVVEAGSSIGALSTGIGQALQGVSQSSASIASSPAVQDVINSALGSSSLKSSAPEVAQGLTTRLMAGDVDSAKSYLAYQTGMSTSDADAKINDLKAKFDQTAKVMAEKAANGIADAGWTLLATFILGLVASSIGGMLGADSNNGRPLAVSEYGSRQFSSAAYSI